MEFLVKDIQKIIGEHWSNVTNKQSSNNQLKLRWWQSQHIIKHVNKVVYGESLPGLSQGLIQLVRSREKKLLPFEKAISIGGGSGQNWTVTLRFKAPSRLAVTPFLTQSSASPFFWPVPG